MESAPSPKSPSSSSSHADALVWMDLEMSGLDAEKERILEIAVLVTDGDLNVLAEGPELVLTQPESLLAGMDDWNRQHHGESGLTERVRHSSIDEPQAENQILEFLQPFCEARVAPLAGNSIHQDRRFIRRYMPKLDRFLHYRMVDVSTIKELARRWYPEQLEQAPIKKASHRALDDIRESIEELRFYRNTMFRAP